MASSLGMPPLARVGQSICDWLASHCRAVEEAAANGGLYREPDDVIGSACTCDVTIKSFQSWLKVVRAVFAMAV